MDSKRPFSYLCRLQYLGFRYHGWQKQPNAKTIQGMIDKSLESIYSKADIQTLGASRTDAGVSCENGAFQILSSAELDPVLLLTQINQKLPGDIKILSCEQVSHSFNLISQVKSKEYHYRFHLGTKIHPFASPNLVFFDGEIDIDLMKNAAKIFVGNHDFTAFSSDQKIEKNRSREIFESEIYDENESLWTFPSSTANWVYSVRGNGFLRHQVRIVMGAMLDVGQGKLTLSELKQELQSPSTKAISFMVPAHGLILHDLEIEM